MGRLGSSRVKLFLGGGLALLSLFLLRGALHILKAPTLGYPPAPSYAYALKQVELTSYRDGVKKWQLKAPEVEVNRTQEHIVLRGGVAGIFFGEEKKTYTFSAREGEYWVPTRRAAATEVHLLGKELSLKAPSLLFSGTGDQLELPKPFVGKVGKMAFRSAHGALHFDQEVLELAQVQGTLHVPEP